MNQTRINLGTTRPDLMMNQTRTVLIRGYVRNVIVRGQYEDGDFYCTTSSLAGERVPAHLFYHRDQNGFLLLRDSVEFLRNHSDHPIEIEQIPQKTNE